MTTRRRFLTLMVTAVAAVGMLAGDALLAGKGGGKPPNLSLTVTISPSSIAEGESTTVTVTRSSSDVAVDVALSSAAPTQASVTAPATVTLNVGETTATFTVNGVPDGATDGNQTVAITASAEGYQSGSANLTVTDSLVEYQLTWLGSFGGSSSALAINEAGTIVGYSYNAAGKMRAAVFTSSGPVDLNDEILDLDLLPSDRKDWIAYAATDINDLGQITGNISPSGVWEEVHPFIYDRVAGTLVILDQLYGVSTLSRAINNLGEIAGQYEGAGSGAFAYSPGGSLIDMGPGIYTNIGGLNDMGQVVFDVAAEEYSWRYTPNATLGDTGTYDTFPGRDLALNCFGDVAGRFKTATKGKNKYVNSIYRAATPDNIEVLYEGGSASFTCINDERDVCFKADGRLVLYTDNARLGLVDLDLLVTASDDASLLDWFDGAIRPLELTNRNATGFPIISGEGHFPGGITEAFVLIPVAPSSP